MTGSQLDLISGSGLAEQAARQSAVADIAAAVMAEVTRPNTTKAYAVDWTSWTRFIAYCHQQGRQVPLVPTHPHPDDLVAFALWSATGPTWPDGARQARSRALAPETIRRRLTGVLAGWKSRGVDYPRGITEPARRFVDDYERRLIEHKQPTGRGQAPAVTIEELRRIAAATPDTLAGLRDMALVTVGFAIGARSAELAHLDVDDLVDHPRGMTVHVRVSKKGHRQPRVIYGQNPATCPVSCWRRWRDAAALITGPALRQVRHERLGGRLSPEAVSDRVTVAGQRARLERRLTGHSLRSGFATTAREAGRKDHQIADQGGWTRGSAALQLYMRNVDDWVDNVLVGIGL